MGNEGNSVNTVLQMSNQLEGQVSQGQSLFFVIIIAHRGTSLAWLSVCTWRGVRIHVRHDSITLQIGPSHFYHRDFIRAEECLHSCGSGSI